MKFHKSISILNCVIEITGQETKDGRRGVMIDFNSRSVNLSLVFSIKLKNKNNIAIG